MSTDAIPQNVALGSCGKRLGPLTPPPTDSESIEGPAGGVSGWAGLVVAVVAMGAGLGLALGRRRPEPEESQPA